MGRVLLEARRTTRSITPGTMIGHSYTHTQTTPVNTP